jgi:hypothetical protein
MEIPVLKKSEIKFDANQYGGRMAALDTDGKFAFTPTCCKEEFFYAVAKNTAFYKYRNREELDAMIGEPSSGKIDRRRPRFVYFVGKNNVPKVKVLARRVLRIMTMVCERMEQSKPTVAVTDGHGGIVVSLPRIFIRSAYATSAALTFIRAAAQSVFSFDTLDDFIDTAIGLTYLPDGYHLSRAETNQTLDSFFNRELPCMKRKGFDSWRRADLGESDYDGIEMHGIATYSISRENE